MVFDDTALLRVTDRIAVVNTLEIDRRRASVQEGTSSSNPITDSSSSSSSGYISCMAP